LLLVGFTLASLSGIALVVKRKNARADSLSEIPVIKQKISKIVIISFAIF